MAPPEASSAVRALTDDVITTSLGIIFGNTIPALGLAPDDGNEIPSLTTDNVGPGGKHFLTTFPYLGNPRSDGNRQARACRPKTMKKLLLVTTVALAVVGAWAGYAYLYSAAAPRLAATADLHLPFDSDSIDRDIASNERAVHEDPGAALNWSYVSSAYMVRSRESDDLATAVKAEKAARRSLEIRKLGNVGAWNKLIASLLQEHRFKDALSECERAEAARIYSDDTALLRVESLIEIGRYDDAGVLLSKFPRIAENAAGYSVVARLLDVKGRPDAAVVLYRRAADEVDRNAGMPSYAVAWFHARLAMQLAKVGKHPEAKREYDRALALYPRDYKSLAGLARLAAQDGHWQEAIEWGNRSDEVAQMADVRALVGDAYAMLGDHTEAEEQYNRVAALVGRPSGLNDGLHEVTPAAGTHGHRLDRQYALFCADHRRDPDGAYAAALRDFGAREDIYAYDTLAWVCLQRGDSAEAAKAAQRALATGTKDPMVLYHAGAIFVATGQDARALALLREALSIDPHFDGIAAPKAAATVQRLAASSIPSVGRTQSNASTQQSIDYGFSGRRTGRRLRAI